MQKHFPANFVISPHVHRRDQLIFAASGTMRVRTDSHSWIVPPRRALYMPGGATHAISMRNPVDMRTLYIEPGAHRDLPAACAVITPSVLLRELIDALLDEPENYDQSARGHWLGRLILDEVPREIPKPQHSDALGSASFTGMRTRHRNARRPEGADRFQRPRRRLRAHSGAALRQ